MDMNQILPTVSSTDPESLKALIEYVDGMNSSLTRILSQDDHVRDSRINQWVAANYKNTFLGPVAERMLQSTRFFQKASLPVTSFNSQAAIASSVEFSSEEQQVVDRIALNKLLSQTFISSMFSAKLLVQLKCDYMHCKNPSEYKSEHFFDELQVNLDEMKARDIQTAINNSFNALTKTRIPEHLLQQSCSGCAKLRQSPTWCFEQLPIVLKVWITGERKLLNISSWVTLINESNASGYAPVHCRISSLALKSGSKFIFAKPVEDKIEIYSENGSKIVRNLPSDSQIKLILLEKIN